jgi:hypothetical protein
MVRFGQYIRVGQVELTPTGYEFFKMTVFLPFDYLAFDFSAFRSFGFSIIWRSINRLGPDI